MKNTSPALRALYIVLVPVVLLIILLNTGWLQSVLPAATVAGHSYTTIEYNFYYFDYYNAFLKEHEDDLAEMGYDSTTSARAQQYDDDMTWQDYFLGEAEKEMSECAYYHDLAEDAGYEFTESDLSIYNEQIAYNQELMDNFGLKANNFYISYYGRGMTEQKYTEMLTYKSEALSYKKYLIRNASISDSEIAQYLASNDSGSDYMSVNLSVITVSAIPDRATDLIGEAQLAALSEKLSAISDRYDKRYISSKTNEGMDFDELQSAYSDCLLGDETGTLDDATRDDLPDIISDIYTYDQDSLSEGDTRCITDDETGIGYFIIFNGFGSSGEDAEAFDVLAKQKTEDAADEASQGAYAVVRNRIGMSLATN